MGFFLNPAGFVVVVGAAAAIALVVLVVTRLQPNAARREAMKKHLVRLPQYAIGLVVLVGAALTLLYS